MSNSIPITHRWFKASLLVGFWTLVGSIYITSGLLIHLTTGAEQPYTLGRALWTLVGWHMWIPATLVVVWLARRFPVVRQNGLRNLVLHFVAAPCVSLAGSVIYGGIRGLVTWSVGPLDEAWFSDMVSRIFLNNVTIDSVIYMSILVGVHAFEYYRKFREQELHASRLEAELAEAQLRALRLQLHPHFLFNTFHTIAMLVRQERGEEAVNTIAELSDFLRYVLDTMGAQEVNLEREIDFLKSYTAIEQIRFKDRLDVQIDVTPDALPALVPNLILQPLVENAIHHGIEPVGGPGRIAVVVRRERGRLRIRVQDNGVGVPDDWQLDAQEGVGLANTKARLERLYKDDHHLTLSNMADGGLMVTIVIPYRTAASMPQPASARAAPSLPSASA